MFIVAIVLWIVILLVVCTKAADAHNNSEAMFADPDGGYVLILLCLFGIWLF